MFCTDFEYGQKRRVRIFVDVFHVLYFSPDPFRALPLLICMLGESRGVMQRCFCLGDCMCRSVGRLWFEEVGNVYGLYRCVRWVQGFVGSFCFAPTVVCVSRTYFVFCC